jgi:hypothetical protein
MTPPDNGRPACRRLHRFLVAAALLAAASGYAWAAAVRAPFSLNVSMEPKVTCASRVTTALGLPQVKVACGEVRVGDPRYLLHVYRDGEWLGTIDGDNASGTITSWRVYHAANRDYLEIMVGW